MRDAARAAVHGATAAASRGGGPAGQATVGSEDVAAQSVWRVLAEGRVVPRAVGAKLLASGLARAVAEAVETLQSAREGTVSIAVALAGQELGAPVLPPAVSDVFPADRDNDFWEEVVAARGQAYALREVLDSPKLKELAAIGELKAGSVQAQSELAAVKSAVMAIAGSGLSAELSDGLVRKAMIYDPTCSAGWHVVEACGYANV